MTLHGKAGKKVNACAQVPLHNTLSVSLLSQISAYVISKAKSVTVDIVLHAKALFKAVSCLTCLKGLGHAIFFKQFQH